MNRENIIEALKKSGGKNLHYSLLNDFATAILALNQPAQLDGLKWADVKKEFKKEWAYGAYKNPDAVVAWFEDYIKTAQRMSLQGVARPSKESIIKALYDCAAVGLIDGGVMMTRVFEKEADALEQLNESPPIAEGGSHNPSPLTK